MTRPEHRPVPGEAPQDAPALPQADTRKPGPPVWVGWVAALTPEGVVRRKVRIATPHLATFATEERYPPDHRSTVAIQIQQDMMRDDFLAELSKAKEGR